MKATLLLPTLNEEEGLRKILPRIHPEWCDQVLLVDGGSQDETLAVAKAWGCEVLVQKQPGLRAAYREAWPFIRNDIVITFSPDGNCIPEAIPNLLRKLEEGYDMVIVSRYLDHAKSADDDLVTGFGNRFFTGLINLLFRSHYTDTMNIFRGYKKDLMQKLEVEKGAAPILEKILCTHAGIEPLLSIRAGKQKLRVAEIPADEPKRIGGKRKLQIVRWGLIYLYQVVRDFLW